jgi:hypothetical protein
MRQHPRKGEGIKKIKVQDEKDCQKRKKLLVKIHPP